MALRVRRLTVAAAVLAAATTGVLATLLAAAPAAPASATAYRYWSVWLGGSGWQYGAFNPGYKKVSAGDVVGWRFAVQGDAGDATEPRATPSYADLCPGKPGTMAVVVDFGTTSDEPPGESPPYSTPQVRCPPETGSVSVDQATEDAGFPLRICPNGLVGGIDGYPKSECAPAVAPASTAPTPPPPPASTATAPRANRAAAAAPPSAARSTPAPTAPTPAPTGDATASGTAAPSPAPASAAPTSPAAATARTVEPTATTSRASGLGAAWPAAVAVAVSCGLGVAAYLRHRRSA